MNPASIIMLSIGIACITLYLARLLDNWYKHKLNKRNMEKLPEKWCLLVEDVSQIEKYLITKYGCVDPWITKKKTNMYLYSQAVWGAPGYVSDRFDKEFTQISFDGFKRLVLKEEALNPTPKFEVGWYRWDAKHDKYPDRLWYVKASSIHKNTLAYTERINKDGSHRNITEHCDYDNELVRLSSLSEIQQYLPEGHVDKVKSTEFKVGDWVVPNFETALIKKDTAYEILRIDGNTLYLNTRLGSNSYVNEDNKFRSATPEEIAKVTGKKEQPMNTYGLKIGDLIPVKVIIAWGKLNNFYDEYQFRYADSFTMNSEIANFFVNKEGITIFSRQGSSKGVGFKAEGFKEFMDNFDKPKTVEPVKQELASLPEKWCIQWKTREIFDVVQKHFRAKALCSYLENSWNDYENKYWSYSNNQSFPDRVEITFDQFKKWVLKEEKPMEPKSLVGRWVKSLKDNCQCSGSKKDEYYKITYQGTINSYFNFINPAGLSMSGDFSSTDTWELMPEGFVPPSKQEVPVKSEATMSKEELLAEAKRRYPIGTKFKLIPLYPGDEIKEGRVEEYTQRDNDRISSGGNFIYYKGKWAEVIKPEPSKIDERFKGFSYEPIKEWVQVEWGSNHAIKKTGKLAHQQPIVLKNKKTIFKLKTKKQL